MIDEAKERELFERVITSSPYEKDISRFPTDAKSYAWPGMYRKYETCLSWDIWLDRARIADEEAQKLKAERDRLARFAKEILELALCLSSDGPDSAVKETLFDRLESSGLIDSKGFVIGGWDK